LCVATERARGFDGRSRDHVLEEGATTFRGVLNPDVSVVVRLAGQVLSGGRTRPEYDEEGAELHRFDACIDLDRAAV